MKAEELRGMTSDELVRKVEDYKEEMFNLRFMKAKNRIENPLRMREIRRDIARIHTIITERAQSNK